jgi:type I restriction enzyme M protein
LTTQSATIVQRLWNYCNVLRDDGVSYGDYVEQLTYLLFLKMADELETHYRHILTELGKGAGLIPVIFRKAQNRRALFRPQARQRAPVDQRTVDL